MAIVPVFVDHEAIYRGITGEDDLNERSAQDALPVDALRMRFDNARGMAKEIQDRLTNSPETRY